LFDFQYRETKTPKLYYVTPNAALPGIPIVEEN